MYVRDDSWYVQADASGKTNLAKLIERGAIQTHGAYFGVASGALYVMDPGIGSFSRVTAKGQAKATPRF